MRINQLLKHFAATALMSTAATGVFAQNLMLVGGTDFNPSVPESGKAYIGTDEIQMTGILGGKLTFTGIQPSSSDDLGYDYSDQTVNQGERIKSHFHDGEFMAITRNPIQLDSLHYIDDKSEDWGVLWSRVSGKSNKTILSYRVEGLVPNSPVRLVIKYRSIIDPENPGYESLKCGPTGSQMTSIKVAEQADMFNKTAGNDALPLSQGKDGIYTSTIAKVNSIGEYTVNINMSSQFMDLDCASIQITSIEVYGLINPQIYSEDGNTICAGEIASIKLRDEYKGVSYQWYDGNTAIPGATSPNYSFETTNDDIFNLQLKVTYEDVILESNKLALNVEKCCVLLDEKGKELVVPRKIIFKEDFGEIDLSDPTGLTYKVWDYSDITNPVQVTKKTTTPFRYELDDAPLGCTFQGKGPLVDGEYTVAGVLTSYGDPYKDLEGARLGWAGNLHGITLPYGIHFDHSGTPEGCCLLINCKDKTAGEPIYKREITGLCKGKQLFFETYMSIFTSSSAGPYRPCDVTVRVTEIGNPSNVVESRASQTIPEDGGTGDWVKISGAFFIEKGEGVLLEVINNVDTDQNGNDLAIDDIIVRTCDVPSVGISMGAEDLLVDSHSNQLIINANPTKALSAYFQNLNYLYQWTTTPDDKESWARISEPTSLQSIRCGQEVLNALLSEKAVYFRVIAGDSTVLSETPDEYYNPDEICKAYSVSKTGFVMAIPDPCLNKPEAPKSESLIYTVNGHENEILTTENFSQILNEDLVLLWYTSDDPTVEPDSHGMKSVVIDRSKASETPYIFYIAYKEGFCYSDRAKVEITITPATDVANVVANEDDIVNVYSILGTLVKANVKRSEALNGLINGIYLVGNQKVVVNK